MKRQVIFIAIVTMLFMNSDALSLEGDSVVIGDQTGDIPNMIFRYEIIDSESEMPVAGAIITLSDNRRRYFTLTTSRRGVAVMVALYDGMLPVYEGTLKVVADGYKPYEETYDPRKLRVGGEGIYLEGMQPPRSYGDSDAGWGVGATRVPSIREIIEAVKEGLYEHAYSSYERTKVPDCFEFRVRMKRIQHKPGRSRSNR